MLIGVFLYFLLTIAVLALVFLPVVRERVLAGVGAAWTSGFRAAATSHHRWTRQAARGTESAQEAAQRAARALRRNALALSIAGASIVGLPFCAVMLRGYFRVDSFDPNASRAVDERVADLLRGEQLVPPPPLPPEFFTTPEVEQWQPMANSASRQWDLLDDTFRQRLLLTFRLMHEQYGIDMVLVEGYRSPQRQAALAALGPSVTRAGPFESYHQYGLAADCAFLRDGRIVISEKDAWAMDAYEHYGQVARSLGLVWGGDWHGLRDLGHVELHRAGMGPGAGGHRAADKAPDTGGGQP
ncbi:MAG TPA: M15 family metallopeptidase [Burkholderiaceae bacterium]